MKNLTTQNQKSVDKPLVRLSEIQEAGNFHPVAFIKQIKNYKKLRDIEELHARAILGLIFTRAYNLSGLKGVIDEIHKQDIVQMVKIKFGGLSLEEIDYAFRHDRYSGEPTNHFHLFNAEYVAKVLSRFKKFVSQTKLQNNINERLPEKKEVTLAEKERWHQDFLKVIFYEIKEKGFYDQAWRVYDDYKDTIGPEDGIKKRLFRIQLGYFLKKKSRSYEPTKSDMDRVKETCKNIVMINFIKKNLSSYDEFLKSLEKQN